MQIGGAEFTMGFAKEAEDCEDPKVALKVVVFGMDNIETAQSVYSKIAAVLRDMDPELELAEIRSDKSTLN